MQNCMLLVLSGTSLIQKIFDCCAGLHIPQISEQKTSGQDFPRNWLSAMRQFVLRLICGICWSCIVRAMQSLHDDMPRCLAAVITTRGYYFRYNFFSIYASNLLKFLSIFCSNIKYFPVNITLLIVLFAGVAILMTSNVYYCKSSKLWTITA